jgi:hypothetical protein
VALLALLTVPAALSACRTAEPATPDGMAAMDAARAHLRDRHVEALVEGVILDRDHEHAITEFTVRGESDRRALRLRRDGRRWVVEEEIAP